MNFHMVSKMSNMKVMIHFPKAEFVERLKTQGLVQLVLLASL